LEEAVIEIYDINNGKLKYSAYTLSQLCEMVTEDYAYHTGDEDNDVVDWIEEKARKLPSGPKRNRGLGHLRHLLEFGEEENDRAFASRISLLLGEMAIDDGRHECAIEYFEKSVNLAPDRVEALHQLAKALAATGQYEKAVEVLRKANGIHPSEEAYLALADMLEKMKRPKDHERVLRSLLRDCPRSIKGTYALALLCRRHGKHRAAARLVQRIVDLGQDGQQGFAPFFEDFTEALIWSKCNYEARKINRILEFLDEEQERNPAGRLSLLKAVMLYKLDKRLCREECHYELSKYFEGIGYEKAIVLEDVCELAEVFGREFARGAVRFIKSQFSRQTQSGQNHQLHRPAASFAGRERGSNS
jgi:tetratricopeptide (TPR) repeat protein